MEEEQAHKYLFIDADQDIIEEIRNQYLNSKKITEEMKEKVEDICSFFELTSDPKEPSSQDDQ